MSEMKITELRRPGAGVLEDVPVQFLWDAQNHSMMQDTLDLELQVNTNREMPAGADEPVEQVLSVEWKEIELHGEWKDSWAGQGFAKRTFTEFARLVQRVPLVRFEHGQHSLVGLLTNLKIKERTEFEVGWTVKFSVHRNENIGPPSAPVVAPQSTVNFTQRIQTQRDSLEKINNVLEFAKTLPLSTQDIDDALDNVGDLVTTVDGAEFATNAIAFENPESLDFMEMADRAQHKLLAVAAAFSNIRNQAQTSLLDVQELISSDVLAYNDVIANLRFEEWVRTQQTECIRMIGEARASEIDARSRATRRPRGIHRVRQGDTLDRVSMKWYGTPDSGRFIRDANNLDSILLPPGLDLIIPDVTT